MSAEKFNIFSFTGKMKVLHLTWFAFFLTFVVWFNLAPLLKSIQATFGLSKAQVTTLLILNVALTIPARILIGMLTDHFGPRRVYSALLAVASIPCFVFAFAVSFFDIFNSGSSMSRRLGNAVLACEAARRALVRDMSQDSNRPMIMERK